MCISSLGAQTFSDDLLGFEINTSVIITAVIIVWLNLEDKCGKTTRRHSELIKKFKLSNQWNYNKLKSALSLIFWEFKDWIKYWIYRSTEGALVADFVQEYEWISVIMIKKFKVSN